MNNNKSENLYVKESGAEYIAKTYSIHEAKTNFSKLIKRAAAGETIYIGGYGKPEVLIKAANKSEINANLRADAFGGMKGKMELNEGWDAPLPEDIVNEFYSIRGLEDFEKND